MKKFLILILICFAQNTFSQTTTKDTPIVATPPQGSIPNEDYQIYNMAGITTKPEFPGGQLGFESFTKQSYQTPDVAGIKGKVYTTFIIEKDGSLSDIKILRDLGRGTGQEAIRTLKNSPKWTPGTKDGKQVRVLYPASISINYL
ncbi:energy transducer TonB [Flavobacterium sp. F-65]|jgi:hypothetical protein|uniref:Energy transducer TonB n=1 Tax=Flavobacterium pisciphilum TaxID=2893755 RepID=A0ABS8MX93_9FLAO|nr:energy transducer TonB [Flavobacterium sp. F-65]MCC9073401.1 energy transducer TonB [Flavobacterium sp. F-65]